jgi:hypothetical protein
MIQRSLATVLAVATLLVAVNATSTVAAAESPAVIAARASFQGITRSFTASVSPLGQASPVLTAQQKVLFRNLITQQYETSLQTLALLRATFLSRARSSDVAAINLAYSQAVTQLTTAYSLAYSQLSSQSSGAAASAP